MNLDIIAEYLSQLKLETEAVCIYGSYYSGNWIKYKSDIDLILLVPGRNKRYHKISNIKGSEIHAVIISEDILEDDTYNQKYGFFYISKFMNPHFFINDKTGARDRIIHLLTTYFEKYCFLEVFDNPLTINQIISRILLIHLRNYPHFIIKLIKSLREKEGDKNFSLDKMINPYLKILNNSNLLKKKNGFFTLVQKMENRYSPYFDEKMRLTWWQTYQNYRNTHNFLIEKISSVENEIIEKNEVIIQLLSFLKKSADWENKIF